MQDQANKKASTILHSIFVWEKGHDESLMEDVEVQDDLTQERGDTLF